MKREDPVRILLVDDHQMVRAGLRSILEKNPAMEVVGEADSGRMAVEMVQQVAPDVVLMDISMPHLNGIDATRQIAAVRPQTRIIALSMHSDRQFVTEALRAGACGYLLKNSAASELALAIEATTAGKTYLCPDAANVVVQKMLRPDEGDDRSAFAVLTQREREVLQLIAEGKTNKEIAQRLQIGTKTVETHRAQVMEKLKLRSVADLTKYAIRAGLTSLES